jgi:TetR/AcrR family transcriptional regulator, transcriptional repressor for nem operon
MSVTLGDVVESALTERGRASRERIVSAASELIRERGLDETSLDDVIERAGASKSQLYHYFDDRSALLRAVVDHNADSVLGGLPPLGSWRAIRDWFDSMVALQVERDARGGCTIGALVSQLAEADEGARLALAESFVRWQEHLAAGLRELQAAGKLAPRARVDELATTTLAAIQGGLVLTQTTRDPRQLATALDGAYEHLRAYATAPRRGVNDASAP